MLGIALTEYRQNTILLNLFPEKPKLTGKEKKQGKETPFEIELSNLRCKIDHTKFWRIFHRTLGVSIVGQNIWLKEYYKAIYKLKEKEFAWHRNRIHYSNHFWLCEDLFNFLLDNDFGIPQNSIGDALDFDKESKDFTLILSYVILKMAIALFDDIASLSNKLKKDRGSLLGCLRDSKRHPIYMDLSP